MIKYVQNKPIDYPLIESLLAHSQAAHTFTNNGPVKQSLERKLEALLGLDRNEWRVAATNSGTSALYTLISLFEKQAKRKLKWVTPAFTFPVSTVCRLETEIVDIDLKTYTLDPAVIDQFDGVIITTLFGTYPSNLLEIEQLCKDKNKLLILDNASSPFTKIGERNINTFGNASIGSAHHTKYIGFAEGGYAVIPVKYYDEFIQLTNFGFTDDRKYDNLASNAKISDVSAAFILAHVLTYNLERHLEIQQRYIDFIKGIPGVNIFNYQEGVVYGNMPIVFDKPVSHLRFRDVGIEANRYYKPLKALPNSQWLFDRIVNLPLYSTLTDYDLSLILKKVETEAKNG